MLVDCLDIYQLKTAFSQTVLLDFEWKNYIIFTTFFINQNTGFNW